MPRQIATQLAIDDAVGSEELEAAIMYLSERIREAEVKDEPVPFLAYRNRLIFQTTRGLRRHGQSLC